MGLCTEVCARGSVEVVPWLKNAIKTQARLQHENTQWSCMMHDTAKCDVLSVPCMRTASGDIVSSKSPATAELSCQAQLQAHLSSVPAAAPRSAAGI